VAHKTESGKNSRAPQALENRVAELFRKFGFRRAERVIKEAHDSRPDVEVPELPGLAVDSKYSKDGWTKAHNFFMNQVETYVGQRRKNEDKTYEWAVMPIRPGGSPDILVVMRIEKFLEMLQQLFLRNKDGAWGCMRCGSPLEETACFAGQYHYRCTVCSMECSTSETPDPKHRGRISSQREKLRAAAPKHEKSVIKDHTVPATTGDGHHPLPGQLSVKDAIERFKNPPAAPSTPRRSKKKETP
jgi:hypothetical protein